MLTALAVSFGAMGLIQWIIVAIVVAGVIGIAMVVAKQAGIVIPAFVVRILWIVLCVIIAVVAIKILASML